MFMSVSTDPARRCFTMITQVLEAVAEDGAALEFASDALRADPEARGSLKIIRMT